MRQVRPEIGEKSKLIRHQKTVHEGRKDYACTKCEQKFGLEHHLLQHQRTVHEGRKDHLCDKCQMRFGDQSNFRRHQKTAHEASDSSTRWRGATEKSYPNEERSSSEY
ncbi:unnamed protein product [Trichogramma brassicae]|uniref:C2H2-type domain-containing protein n=1 Tax=Trichogramma brassicae TaxID=86971 RepID=A0A6H5IEL3_9HYME|nr:unnamed protein product [Trichogramma brassicae]